MWGITSRSRTNLRNFRNPFREKSTKERCDNYKKSYEYYVSKKDGKEKKLRNIRNLLRIIGNLFLISKKSTFFVFSKKKKELSTLNQLPHTQTLYPSKQSTRQLSNLKRTPKHHRGIEPRFSCTTHFTPSSRPRHLAMKNSIIIQYKEKAYKK